MYHMYRSQLLARPRLSASHSTAMLTGQRSPPRHRADANGKLPDVSNAHGPAPPHQRQLRALGGTRSSHAHGQGRFQAVAE